MDRIRIGIVGLAGRGFEHHFATFQSFEDVEITAVCDVKGEFVDRAVAASKGSAKGYHDFRDLLADPNVDAVIVATPPHWHALMACAAMEAGKDVLCEKPMSRTPAEAIAMAKGAKKFKRVTQVGTQVHATENYRRVVDVVRSGVLGQITSIRNFLSMDDKGEGIGSPADTDPPADLDWNLWLGPAPVAPYNEGRFRDGLHRYFTDYADSWLHELGSHIVDLPIWAAELGQPLSVIAVGERYHTETIADVPDTLDVIWQYPGLQMTWSMNQNNRFNFGIGKPGAGRKIGIAFQGTEGTLLANYSLCDLYDRNGEQVSLDHIPRSTPRSNGHEREFLDCIRTRDEPSCSFNAHLPLHLALNLAHVSLRLGRRLEWDEATLSVKNDPEANAALAPTYREPWKLPVYE